MDDPARRWGDTHDALLSACERDAPNAEVADAARAYYVAMRAYWEARRGGPVADAGGVPYDAAHGDERRADRDDS